MDTTTSTRVLTFNRTKTGRLWATVNGRTGVVWDTPTGWVRWTVGGKPSGLATSKAQAMGFVAELLGDFDGVAVAG